MRKIILLAATVLISASAHAAGTRSLTLASATDPGVAPQASESTPSTDTQKYFGRPSAISSAPAAATAASTAATTPGPNAAPPKSGSQSTAKAEKPRHKREWTDGRIISELHRHGIYWGARP